MGTMVQFKRVVGDVADLEADAEIAIGTTTFAGDGDRMFIQYNGTGILLSHEDARAFLAASGRIASALEYEPIV